MGPLIATQLTDRSTRYKTLTLDGIDVLAQYGTSTAKFMVPLETIALTEEGQGGVSSLTFSIFDPLAEVTFASSALVEFWDVLYQRPLFLGFVQNFSLRPTATGRYIDIVCVGIEVMLDWMLVPSLTIPAGTTVAAAVQSCVYNATGIGYPLRAMTDVNDATNGGSIVAPITKVALLNTINNDVVLTGSSLRESIRTIFANTTSWYNGTPFFATVDMYGGLRVFWASLSGFGGFAIINAPSVGSDTHDEYSQLNISLASTATASRTVSDMDFLLDTSGIVRGVYVQGSTAAGSGLVSDGSGIPGPIAYLSDDTSTTAAIRDTIGQTYLGDFAASARATVRMDPVHVDNLTSGSPVNIRTGSTAVFATDSVFFGNPLSLTIQSIAKTFQVNNREAWSVTVGGFQYSAVKQTRRLTRTARA